MNNEKNLIIDKDVFRKLMSDQRKDIQRGLISYREACKLLGLSKNDFYLEIAKPETKVIPSKSKRGKYIFSSVIREFERIHGTSYSDAIYKGY